MPLLRLSTSAPMSETQKTALLPRLSKVLADCTGKPERYVMVTVDACALMMAGAAGPGAFVDVRGIGGLDGRVNRKLSQALCALLKETLGIAGEAVYITFTDVAATNWGWNSSTFG